MLAPAGALGSSSAKPSIVRSCLPPGSIFACSTNRLKHALLQEPARTFSDPQGG